MEAISEFLEENTAFLICDEAQRTGAITLLARKLYDQEQPLLLLATFPPARTSFQSCPN